MKFSHIYFPFPISINEQPVSIRAQDKQFQFMLLNILFLAELLISGIDLHRTLKDTLCSIHHYH